MVIKMVQKDKGLLSSIKSAVMMIKITDRINNTGATRAQC